MRTCRPTFTSIATTRVHAVVAGYRFIEFDGAITIRRIDTGLEEAVWFGCLTAGLDGRIAEFTSERIRLVATNEPIVAKAGG